MNTTGFINNTGTVGLIYEAAVTNITGSEFVLLLGLIFILIALFMMFNAPLEATAIFILPILIIFVVYSNDLLSFFGLLMIYIGILIAKNWFV